ncbi:U6 snRNA phosphodiesterase Usb1 [Podospora conica]|nr:U6 snRNA phosphodiesterase Usb1 [Schizothecium conicum]
MAPLVDYTSSPSPSPPPTPHEPPPPTLPPLPPSFHDLYASTVRTAPSDSPSLHQGRVRTTPHLPGRWPSHLYLEWHPPTPVHSDLAALVSALRTALLPAGVELHSFLTSDLGAPLPLHVSLSRSLSLTTGEKDGFLREVVDAVSGGTGTGTGTVELEGDGVEWHRTEESGRSFLVLRVREVGRPAAGGNPNPVLTGLLRRCNAVAEGHGQPGLYEWAFGEGEEAVGRAFHVSVAWSFAEPTGEVRRVTEEVFGGARGTEVRIGVDGVKVKIGNVVTHVPLRARGGGRGLLGL